MKLNDHSPYLWIVSVSLRVLSAPEHVQQGVLVCAHQNPLQNHGTPHHPCKSNPYNLKTVQHWNTHKHTHTPYTIFILADPSLVLTSGALHLLAPASLPPATSKTHSTSKPCCQRSTGGDVRPLVLGRIIFQRRHCTTAKLFQWCSVMPILIQHMQDTTQTPSIGLWHPSYAIGSRKLSANEKFFGGAQTVISLLQTTEIKQGVSFIATNKVYTSTNTTTIVWIEKELFFSFLLTQGGCISGLHVCLGAMLHLVILVPKPFRGYWPRQWTAVQRLRVPLQWRN